MKIIHLLSTNKRRGAENYAFELLKTLATSHLALKNKLIFLDYNHKDGLPFLDLSKSNADVIKSRMYFKKISSLRAIIKRENADIIYCHGTSMAKLAILSTLMLKKKPVLVLRKIGITSDWLKKFTFIRMKINQFFFKEIDFCLVMGKRIEQELIHNLKYPKEKIINTFNFRDSTPFILNFSAPSYCKSTEFITLISVAALEPEKNHSLILRTFKSLVDKGLPVKMRLIGDGSLHSELKNWVVNNNLSNLIEFTGVVENVADFLCGSDIFLLCSETEGVPGVLIEAGYAKLPSVCWDVGDVKEVITSETGIVTPFHDEKAFELAVHSLVSNRNKQQQMGEAAHKYCMSRFTRKQVLETHQLLFKRIEQQLYA